MFLQHPLKSSTAHMVQNVPQQTACVQNSTVPNLSLQLAAALGLGLCVCGCVCVCVCVCVCGGGGGGGGGQWLLITASFQHPCLSISSGFLSCVISRHSQLCQRDERTSSACGDCVVDTAGYRSLCSPKALCSQRVFALFAQTTHHGIEHGAEQNGSRPLLPVQSPGCCSLS